MGHKGMAISEFAVEHYVGIVYQRNVKGFPLANIYVILQASCLGISLANKSEYLLCIWTRTK